MHHTDVLPHLGTPHSEGNSDGVTLYLVLSLFFFSVQKGELTALHGENVLVYFMYKK